MNLCGDDNGASVQGVADGLKRDEVLVSSGVDDGADAGERIGAPDRAEAVGDLAEDDAGTQRALGGVVGVGHLALGDEDEQVVADLGEALAQTDAVSVSRARLHDRVPVPVEIGAVVLQGAVPEPVWPIRD